MCDRRSFVRSVSPSDVISCPAISTVPEVGLSRPGEDVHERRLAGAGRPHHGRQLARGDLEGDAAQRVDGGVAVAVAAGQVVRRDHGRRGVPVEDALVGERGLDRCVHVESFRLIWECVHRVALPTAERRPEARFGVVLEDDSRVVRAADAPRRRVSYLRYMIEGRMERVAALLVRPRHRRNRDPRGGRGRLPPGRQRREAHRPDLAVRAVGRGHDPPAARAAAVPVRSPRGGLRHRRRRIRHRTGSSPRTRSATSSAFSPRRFLFGMLFQRDRSPIGLGIALGAAAFVVHNDPTQGLGDFGFIAFVFTIAWLAGLALGSQLTAAAQRDPARRAPRARARGRGARRRRRGAGAHRARAPRRRRATRSAS